MIWEEHKYKFNEPKTIPGLVSSIMPTYNRIDFLQVRIEEHLNQTYQNWELIIVNDNSTDQTKEYLDSITDPRIKVINLDINSGCVSIPRNIGITHAQGEYIAHSDDDVIIFPNKFEFLVKGLKTNPESILSYGNRYDCNLMNGDENLYPKVQKDWDGTTHGIDNGQILYRKKVYENIPLIFAKRACDWKLCSRIANVGKFTHIDEFVCVYVWHGENRSLDPNTKIKPLPMGIFKENSNLNIEYLVDLNV